ncbi:MAG: phosphoribosylglycinamide formyltransferase [Lachnospiraceae bacterium]|nr:phosphoribosylglycinamide formyltransferase [Lachnospiraceae bacterium]
MMKIAVLVSGGGTNLQAIIDAINAGKITDAEICLVLSNNKNAYALERAEKAGIPALAISPKDYASRDLFNDALLEAVRKSGAELVVLAGFLCVIPPKMVEAYPDRIINIHPSLIPSFCGTGYYGLKVHEAALERGVRVSGATVHFVDAGTDTGPIILQKAVEVKDGDTPKELQLRIMEQAEWKILPEAIQLIAHDKVTVRGRRVIIAED